jgi:uncharacterized membrane protein YtjA (UPF0391 family)
MTNANCIAHWVGLTLAHYLFVVLKEDVVFRAAVAFFILALVAILFGAAGIAGVSLEIGRLLLFIFLVLSAISFVVGLIGNTRHPPLP